MWTVRNRHFAQQFFSPDGDDPGGGGNPPATPPTPPTPPAKPEFSDAQQQLINDLLAKERKSAEERTELRLKAEADAAIAAEAEKRKNDEAAARGEFDTVRADLEGKVATVEGERDALKTEVDALRTYFDAEYTAAVKDLPDVIAAFKPSDDAPFAERSAWLTKAREQAAKVAGAQAPGNRPNPNPASGDVEVPSAVPKTRMW